MSGAVGGIASFMGVQFASAARVESTAPNGYKLKRKASGEYVLMGAFQWTQGTMGGIEWRELETEFEPVPEPASEAQPKRYQYFYRRSACKARDAYDSRCTCWHDEGTGPHSGARHDDELHKLSWRVRP